jgi:adenosylcobyric acid synthase
LLPLVTTFAPEKLVSRTEGRFASNLGAPWSALAGLKLSGYEIRHGHTEPSGPVEEAIADGRGWASSSVLGVSVHGVFERPEVIAGLLGGRPERSLDAAIEELTDAVVAALDIRRVERLAGVAA